MSTADEGCAGEGLDIVDPTIIIEYIRNNCVYVYVGEVCSFGLLYLKVIVDICGG